MSDAAVVTALLSSCVTLLAGMWLGFKAGHRAGWRDRHAQMIVGAKSRQWANENRVDRL